MEGVNPEAIIAPDGKFRRDFGDNAAFDRQEKMIIILDHYDAEIRRSKKSHKEAIAAITDRANANPRFAEDQEFFALLKEFDTVFEK